jgi:5-(carboxyamino)imidazole ribonucleotide synthase
MVLARRPRTPAQKILETTQDRLIEKDFVKRLGIGTADYADVSSVETLHAAIARIGLPAVIKTRRFGYDGKGQAIIREGDDPAQVWEDLGTKSAILEAFVPFEREISVIAARSADGAVECYDVTENEHRDHILKFARARRDLGCAGRRRAPSPRRSQRADYVGCRSRMFVVAGNGRPHVLVNETRRGCIIPVLTLTRLDLPVRAAHQAIAGWPLASVRHGQVTMTNLIGDDILSYEQWPTAPRHGHLYGRGPRPGRKMGRHRSDPGKQEITLLPCSNTGRPSLSQR